MRKFIRKIEKLGMQATELREAIQNMPPKVAELREAVTMTAGELQQLTADVERNVGDLKTDSRDRLVAALHEVNGSTEVFRDAGYELGEVELELSPVHRLVVHLNRFEDVHLSMLKSLASANKKRSITHALLTAVQQAEAMADNVDINGLVYHRLIFHIGPVPAIRLCWMPEPEDSLWGGSVASASSPAASASTPLGSSYGKDSFFADSDEASPEPAPAEAAPGASVEQPAPTEAAAAAPAAPAVASSRYVGTKSHRSSAATWGAASLERFKKMPSGSKYGR
jgi:hypothetical protein